MAKKRVYPLISRNTDRLLIYLDPGTLPAERMYCVKSVTDTHEEWRIELTEDIIEPRNKRRPYLDNQHRAYLSFDNLGAVRKLPRFGGTAAKLDRLMFTMLKSDLQPYRHKNFSSTKGHKENDPLLVNDGPPDTVEGTLERVQRYVDWLNELRAKYNSNTLITVQFKIEEDGGIGWALLAGSKGGRGE